jgi:hypothetical protein
MIALPEYLEKKLITLAHRKQATTDKILEWALQSLEYDLDDADLGDQALADIASGKEKVLSLEEFNKELANELDS